MRIRKWVVSQRAKRLILTILLLLGAFLAIGFMPPVFWVLLVGGIAWFLFKLANRIRRNRRGDTETY